MKCQVGIVTNFGPNLSSALGVADQLEDSLLGFGHSVAPRAIVGKQAQPQDPGLLAAIKHQIRRRVSAEKYQRYLRGSDSTALWIRNLYVAASKVRHKHLSKDQRIGSSIDGLITRKHYEVWRSGLADPSVDYIFVIEDDVRTKPNSPNSLGKTLRCIASSRPLYVDLAGGFAQQRIARAVIDTESFPVSDGASECYFLPKLTTNTAAAYAVSRSTAAFLCSTFTSKSDFSLFAVDTFMNHAFTLLKASDKECCVWSVPPVFSHGSFTGETTSWRTGGASDSQDVAETVGRKK